MFYDYMSCVGLTSSSVLVMCSVMFYFFFFKQKTAYEMRISDWSSDVCSSDLSDYHRPTQDFRELQRAELGEPDKFGSAFIRCGELRCSTAHIRRRSGWTMAANLYRGTWICGHTSAV